MISKENLADAIGDFITLVSQEGASEEEISLTMLELKEWTSESRISDIIFYGEKERGTKEIATEALLREELYAQGGREAVNSHIEQLMRDALADSEIQDPYRISAMMILKDIEDERAREETAIKKAPKR